MKAVCYAIVMVFLFLCLFGCGNEQNNDYAEKETITPAKIDILKIGKADCIVINTGNEIVMIDTGEEENLNKIHSYMQKNGYTKVDTLIVTHYDKDHIGGAADIIAKYNVSTVIESSFTSSSLYYLNYHSLIEEKGISLLKLKENYSFARDSCSFQINIPKKEKYSTKEDNNSSLVISMEIGNRRFLFCGDAMELRLRELIEEGIGHYDFVKLPYHGRYLENYDEFLNMVKPTYGAITCSNKNPASEDVLSLLQRCETEVYQTRDGEINVLTDGTKLKISQ